MSSCLKNCCFVVFLYINLFLWSYFFSPLLFSYLLTVLFIQGKLYYHFSLYIITLDTSPFKENFLFLVLLNTKKSFCKGIFRIRWMSVCTLRVESYFQYNTFSLWYIRFQKRIPLHISCKWISIIYDFHFEGSTSI